jgi:hypothetical protein
MVADMVPFSSPSGATWAPSKLFPVLDREHEMTTNVASTINRSCFQKPRVIFPKRGIAGTPFLQNQGCANRMPKRHFCNCLERKGFTVLFEGKTLSDISKISSPMEKLPKPLYHSPQRSIGLRLSTSPIPETN